MIIQHNILAMNAQRMFGINDRVQKKNTERLSSGYRINRAADDAAGLAISEKMRRQVRGLTQASANCQDGISLVQIADGAMAEIDDMLHRCTELSVKAANATLTDTDREYIQREIDSLKDEIESISVKTNFNEIQVLRGAGATYTTTTGGAVTLGGLPDWVDLGAAGTSGALTDINPANNSASTIIDFSSFDGSPEKIAELTAENTGFYTTCCTCTNHYSIKFTNDPAGTLTKSNSGNHYIFAVGIGGVTTPEDLVSNILSTLPNPLTAGSSPHYTALMDMGDGKLMVYDNRDNQRSSFSNGYGLLGPGIAYSSSELNTEDSPETIIIQAGTENDPDQRIPIELPAISKTMLHINNSEVTTIPKARQAIDDFKYALEYVAKERSRMGAYQNRLEHTIKNLDNVVENTAAAESRIRDTDMAKTMVDYSNTNILLQAGVSMMTQANQSSDTVLSLLR